ncbi:MAG TPA: hypothetical protein VFD70_08280 [Anaerolineae bacterium]|nr:hypothetical protein [Anaerolineae bacterium]
MDQKEFLGERSRGSKLAAIAGLVIVFAFFLPWVRACSLDLSGYDIASNRPGTVQDAWVYWLVPLGGIVCILLLFLIDTRESSARIAGAIIRLVTAVIGFFPVLALWLNVQQRGSGLVEILVGGYLTALGYLGIFVSFFIDLMNPPPPET